MRQYLILTLVFSLAGALMFIGCATVNQAAMQRSAYVDAHPELSELMADPINNGQIMVGMTSEMVQVAWGKPVRMETVEAEDAATQWIYGNYFVGGNITSLYFDQDNVLVRYEVNYDQTHANNGTVESNGSPRGTLTGSDVLLSKGSGSRP